MTGSGLGHVPEDPLEISNCVRLTCREIDV